MITHYDITIQGTICGSIWWPFGARCGRDIKVNLSNEIARIYSQDGSRATLRDAIELVICENDGDFQSAKFTSDTDIIVRSGKRTRYWPVTAFPSIVDYVDAEAFSSDFNGGDE